VLYDDGPLWRWLEERRLAEPAFRVPLTAPLVFRVGGRRRRLPPLPVIRSLRRIRRTAPPVDASFSEWAEKLVGPDDSRRLANFAGVAIFDHDPGRFSAAFVHERLRRASALPPAARYVPGGWSTLVDRLETYARALGVDIHTNTRVDVLPEAPVVLAVPHRVARVLLDDNTLLETGTRVACVDLGLTGPRRPPFIVSDLDASGWIETFSRVDPSLAPAGHHLVQAQAGMLPDEDLDRAVGRIEALLDVGMSGWRSRVVWQRRAHHANATGAVDLPGRTWRDRNAIDRGHGIVLVNDQVAAPGLLSEVSYAAALHGVDLLRAQGRFVTTLRTPTARAGRS
jgi:hypothetical protein